MLSKNILSLLLVLLLAFVFTAIIGRFIIPILKKLKVGQSERLDGPRTHLKKQGTPTMGGIMMIISIALFVTIESIINSNLRMEILPIALASLGYGIVGFIDDYKKVVLKITDIVWNLPRWIYVILMIFVMLGTTNAINLTDGVDGLAGSVTAIIVGSLSVISYKCNLIGVATFGIIVVGTICGFLIYNFHKAKVIMGDTGSLLLGGVVSSMAIIMQNPLILIIVAIIPIVETLSVILQVLSGFFRGKLLFKMAPLHHHFELTGWRENRVVGVFSAITFVAAIIAILAC